VAMKGRYRSLRHGGATSIFAPLESFTQPHIIAIPMKRSILTLVLLLPLLALAAHAQKGYPRTLYVIYDGALVYDSASYLSPVLGELRSGDSVSVQGSEKKFFRIAFADREGYILGVNVAEKKPAAGKVVSGKSKKGGARKKESAVMERRASISDSTRQVSDGAIPLTDSLARKGAASPDGEQPGEPKKRRSESSGSESSESKAQQCRATTKSGKRCSRTTSDPSGFCWQHKE